MFGVAPPPGVVEIRAVDGTLLVGGSHAFGTALSSGVRLSGSGEVQRVLLSAVRDDDAMAALRRLLRGMGTTDLHLRNDQTIAHLLTQEVVSGRLAILRLPLVSAVRNPASSRRGGAAASDAAVPAPFTQQIREKDTPEMPQGLTDRFLKVLSLVPPHLPEEFRSEFEALLSVESAVALAGLLAVWAGSHAVGVGFVIDAALLATAYALVGWTAFQIGQELAAAGALTVKAETPADLDRAAKLIANIIVKIGVATFIALVTRGLAKRGGGGTPASPAKTPAKPPATSSSTKSASAEGAAAREAAEREARAMALERARRMPPGRQDKILYGERVPNPDSPGGLSNRVIGGHSPRITNLSGYTAEVIARNPDGTTVVKFKKQFSDGSWSKMKKSTLAPDSWSDSKIIQTTHKVADSPAVMTRASDGATLHRMSVDGIQWEVVRGGDGVITSSYPTGGTPTSSF